MISIKLIDVEERCTHTGGDRIVKEASESLRTTLPAFLKAVRSAVERDGGSDLTGMQKYTHHLRTLAHA